MTNRAEVHLRKKLGKATEEIDCTCGKRHEKLWRIYRKTYSEGFTSWVIINGREYIFYRFGIEVDVLPKDAVELACLEVHRFWTT